MPTLQVNSLEGRRARQCWKLFGGWTCRARENPSDKRPLKNALRHSCGVWLFEKDGWQHTMHVCRKCGHRETIESKEIRK